MRGFGTSWRNEFPVSYGSVKLSRSQGNSRGLSACRANMANALRIVFLLEEFARASVYPMRKVYCTYIEISLIQGQVRSPRDPPPTPTSHLVRIGPDARVRYDEFVGQLL
ncbi:hypothetical protein E4U28_001027 [Claviceps purpurea]|nr:hypothetical protein E4U28_001027 [Claviceps purpurea]